MNLVLGNGIKKISQSLSAEVATLRRALLVDALELKLLGGKPPRHCKVSFIDGGNSRIVGGRLEFTLTQAGWLSHFVYDSSAFLYKPNIRAKKFTIYKVTLTVILSQQISKILMILFLSFFQFLDQINLLLLLDYNPYKAQLNGAARYL